MIVVYKEYYHSFNDLVNKANSNHTHSNYSLTSHTHNNYVTSTQVTSIVNTAIQNGTIEVSSKMFKSINHYNVSGNTKGITIQGSGIIFVNSCYAYRSDDYYSTIDIDNNNFYIDSESFNNKKYLFKEKVIIKNNRNDSDWSKISVTVGLFN